MKEGHRLKFGPCIFSDLGFATRITSIATREINLISLFGLRVLKRLELCSKAELQTYNIKFFDESMSNIDPFFFSGEYAATSISDESL